jgi:hypothetical protein
MVAEPALLSPGIIDKRMRIAPQLRRILSIVARAFAAPR